MAKAAHITVLIPFYNEAGNIGPLLEEVHAAYQGLDIEVIGVNDASADTTAAELAAAKQRWPETLTVLTHVQRRGKSAALMTGLRSARGEWVQLLDGDGQNNPADGRRVYDAVIAHGAPPALGLIAGRRTSRNDSGFKWLQSRIGNGVRRLLLRDEVTDTGCGFKLIRRRAFEDVPYFASLHRFLPALVKRAGWDLMEQPVEDRRRLHGASKYGFVDRLFAGLFDMIGMVWLMRRGGYGIAREWNDPRVQGPVQGDSEKMADR
jgi:dolichol-phosphate mannosyltransferase